MNWICPLSSDLRIVPYRAYPGAGVWSPGERGACVVFRRLALYPFRGRLYPQTLSLG